MEIPRGRRALLIGGAATAAVALAYACSPKEAAVTEVIDPNVILVEDVRRFYPGLEGKTAPDIYKINVGGRVSLVINYSGIKLNQEALTGVFSYFEGLATSGSKLDMVAQGTGKITKINIEPRVSSKRMLFVVDENTPRPEWTTNDLAATTLRFKNHTVGFARALRDKQYPGTRFPDNKLNSSHHITVEICQSLVHAVPADKSQTAIATEGQEQICNGYGFGHLVRQTGNTYPDYARQFPIQVSIGADGPKTELIKMDAGSYNGIQVKGLIVS